MLALTFWESFFLLVILEYGRYSGLIQNRGLKAIDLADYLPAENKLMPFDFAPQLWNGLIEGRHPRVLGEQDWDQYAG